MNIKYPSSLKGKRTSYLWYTFNFPSVLILGKQRLQVAKNKNWITVYQMQFHHLDKPHELKMNKLLSIWMIWPLII